MSCCMEERYHATDSLYVEIPVSNAFWLSDFAILLHNFPVLFSPAISGDVPF